MLSLDEMMLLLQNDVYKNSKRLIVNLKHAKGCYKFIAEKSNIEFKFTLNEDFKLSESGIKLTFVWVVKPFIIAKEIIELRSRIFENALNKTLDDFDLCDLFKCADYYWMDYKPEKIRHLHNVLMAFLGDPKIEKAILDISGLDNLEKEEKYRLLIKRTDQRFKEVIKRCVRDKNQSERIKMLEEELGPELVLESIKNSKKPGHLTKDEEGSSGE